jgi:tetratricopeptide (TPR) repeat protein
MSPEQAGGEGLIDGRSDVYSLGCVLFEMIAGTPPFEHATARAMLTSHLIGEVPSLEERRPETPHALSQAVERAMSKMPEERFATAEEMAAALKDARIEATDDRATTARRLRKGSQKRRRGALGAGIAVAFLLAAVGPTLWDRVFRPASAPAYSVEDPRGSYVIVPSARAGETPAEEALAVDVADWLAFRLSGLESVRAVQDADKRGVWADLGIEGQTLARLEDGLRLARALRVGTLVTITLRIVGDSVYMEARQYDAGEGYEFGLVQSQAARADLEPRNALIGPFILQILNYRDDETDLGRVLSLSNNPLAHREFEAGRKALQDWRLEEAERHFREAVAQDSTFALAPHYLALTLYWQTTQRADLISDVGGEVARLTETAKRLASEPGLPAGHVPAINAFAAFWLGDYGGARDLYDSILARDSTDSEAWLLRGAVEFVDRWAERSADGKLVPRSNLNVAKRAFETSVRLARDQQLSYGLLFQIDRQVLEAAAGRGCPLFLRPGGALLPPWQIAQAADQPAFCPVMDDSLVWIPSEELKAYTLANAQAGAARLYRETLRSIQMWADYAPDQPRPREEWSAWLLWRRRVLGCDADPAELADVTRRALVNKQIELEIKGDTTLADRVRLAALLWATGDPAAARAQLDHAVPGEEDRSSEVSSELPAEAANLYLAMGRPSLALEAVVGAQLKFNFSYEDPRDGSVVSSGEIQPTFTALRVLGSAGVSGAELTAAFEELDRSWSGPEFTARDRAVLHRASLIWLSPAVLLAPETRRAWLGGMEQHAIEAPVVWRGLQAADEDPPTALRVLEQVTDSLVATRFPRSSELYLAGMLAQRVGKHAVAVKHFERLESCPTSLDAVDFRWGLQALSQLHRARSLEILGRSGESAAAYREFAEAWHNPDADLEHTVAEARAAADRLEP